MTNHHDEDIHPFRIHVPQDALLDLQERLHRSRLPELPDTGWERGVSLASLRELKEHWQHQFDWRKQEQRLNAYPHYTTTIFGQTIHFLHIKSSEPDAVPLMLIHGWPGSFIEFLDVIEPLSQPSTFNVDRAPAFDLVIPSIPGFGYSIPLREPGWTPARIAEAFIQLMDRLGYSRFGVQGGDTGAFIAPEMGRQAPSRIIGIHLNALITFPSGEEGELNQLSEEEQLRVERLHSFNDGYMQIQAKSPNTLACGLHDSPVGQLAWIVEIFKKWSHPAETQQTPSIDLDTMLTNVSLYWFSGTAGSSAQIYYESMNDPSAWVPKERGTVPTGILVSRSRDTAIRSLADKDHHVVHWTECSRGGHFYAMEQPELFSRDVRQFFSFVV